MNSKNSKMSKLQVLISKLTNKLTPEKMKLLGKTENKITKDKNSEHVPHLEITEVVLVIITLSVMIINKIQEYYTRLFQINHFVVY